MERALARVRELDCGLRPQLDGNVFDEEEDDRDGPFRDAVVRATALARSGVPQEETFLVRRLGESYATAQRTPSEEVVCEVLVVALGDRGSVLACPVMCRMLVDGFGSEFLRGEIITAFHTDRHDRRRVLMVLRRVIRDQSEYMCASAMDALARFGGDAVIPELMSHVTERSLEVGAAVVRALATIGTPAAMRMLRVLGQVGSGLRERAMTELSRASFREGRQDSRRPTPKIRAALRCDDPVLRAAAVVAVGEYGDAVAELVSFVTDPSPLVRECITYGLARHATETREAIVALRALRTHDAAEDVRRSAAQKLAELGRRRLPGVDVAEGILGDKDSRWDAN